MQKERSYLSARAFDTKGPMRGFPVNEHQSLEKLGIRFGKDNHLLARMQATMDAIQPDVTTASITTPVQFLQNWLPGFVFVITGARNIDQFVGMQVSGNWDDEEVVQGILERTGTSVPYGDYTNTPFSSWNVNWNTQTVIRFEEGMRVGLLEEARAARAMVDSAAAKRESAALALEIQRNSIGFNGYNSGLNRTYGILNAPGLPAYVTVSNGASGSPLWSTKTFLEITKDIRSAVVALRNQSQDTINPEQVDLTLAVATNSVDWLTTTSDFGISVRDWMSKAYPRMRVVSAPQFNAANGGANIFYLYADSVQDQSTDDGRVFLQVVPAKFQMLGVQQLTKAYEESYSMATAGIMCKRPFAVVRRSGI